MARVMPSQVVQTIDELFPHAVKNQPSSLLMISHTNQLAGILNLLKDVPDELIAAGPSDYSDLILAISAIEETLPFWRARGDVGFMAQVKGFDAITIIRRVLAKCPDEHPPSTTTELLFVNDPALRDNIRRDLGAANRALNNSEWKAATVLAGATIEALLHWRLQEPAPGAPAVQAAAAALLSAGTIKKPNSNIDYWELHQFIEVASHLKLLKPDTSTAARLAQNFRNLIHPGRAARLEQTCDRATAYSAIGALEHVIRDLSQTAAGQRGRLKIEFRSPGYHGESPWRTYVCLSGVGYGRADAGAFRAGTWNAPARTQAHTRWGGTCARSDYGLTVEGGRLSAKKPTLAQNLSRP